MIALTALIAGLFGSPPLSETCAIALEVLPDMACVETPHGAALAVDRDSANRLAIFAQEGEFRFANHFGRHVPRYVVYQVSDEALSNSVRADLSQRGVATVLAWPSLESRTESLRQSLRVTLEAPLRASGRSEAEIDAIVQNQSQALSVRLAGQESSIVPHELAHSWYTETGWPGQSSGVSGHYGGAGPDWMDEMAAILAENDEAATASRGQFRAIYNGGVVLGQVDVQDMINLETLLDQPHPMSGRIPDNDSGNLSVEIGSDASIAAFYVKARVFGDFLIAASGDPMVFGHIMEAFSQGESFNDWLSREGQARGLAGDRQALDAQWREWLVETMGPRPDVAQ